MSPARAATAGVMRARDDRELLKLVEAGDGEAFEALYDRYGARAYRVAWSVCRDDGRAEDAVQDAFISLWQSRATYQPERGSAAVWLLSVVRYRAIDIARRHAKHALERAGEDLIASRPAPGDLAEEAVRRAQAAGFQALLNRLSEAQREVIALAFYGQLSHSEIAERLGLPSGTVKGRIRLGLKNLRADVERLNGREAAGRSDGQTAASVGGGP